MFTDYRGLQVYKHSSWHMLPRSSLTEEGVKGIIPTSNGSLSRHLAIWLNPMLQAVQLPASIADLDTSLTNVDRDTLTLDGKKC